jgi:hypothetical protein
MTTNKSNLKDPTNIKEHRMILAKIIVNDMSLKDLRRSVQENLINTYKDSKNTFLQEYWNYFEETGGHCPFQINSE